MTTTPAPAEVVGAAVAAYLAQDQPTAERLLAEDFVFTSPQDDRLDRAAFLDRCFPTAGRLTSQRTLVLTGIDAERVLLVYEQELRDGSRHRNAEISTVRDGRLVATDVYFGGQY
ncbi:DUF4440 domain-containing protein [Nakamurella leprariae]|uniref:DUF4440 domain-containing protein n=1 Tax=Nakamurella leprariae TaxID=2803911 RepID=A0A938YAB7_9ACTN|nr:DUF4440 domain-containing protein [Nakamurella leprariae]MBM9468810.1 hypothetical protein [Nakamurella leprariae]